MASDRSCNWGDAEWVTQNRDNYKFYEFDEGSPCCRNPPKEVADFMSEEELAEIAALPDLED